MKKVILHLCADIGSDSAPYTDAGYDVRLIGREIGVENYIPPDNVYGIIANPVCTEFSTARTGGKSGDCDKGMVLVKECQRIISECNNLKFYVIENPARGDLRKFIGEPTYEYEPWWYGSPWTKRTALWGWFNIPQRKYHRWDDVPKLEGLYTRPGRGKPSLAFMHYQHKRFIPEFERFTVQDDMSFRSMCSQKFAQAFFEANQ